MKRASKLNISMSHSEPKIQCSNPHCTAYNAIQDVKCHNPKCQTPVVKRYLWATREAIPQEQVEQIIGERYLALTTRMFLDTKPGLSPKTSDEIPEGIVVYLQLFPYYPHIPQVYGQLDGTDAWLLDYGSIPLDRQNGQLQYRELIPRLNSVWQQAQALQQLNWLHQLAKLWQPLSSKNVASSLLDLQLIGINGQVIQLLELKSDGEKPPSLIQLGRSWASLSESAHPTIREALIKLSDCLIRGSIDRPEQVMAVLDRALDICQQSFNYTYEVIARTDSGPNRENNEDAAYPCLESPQILSGKESPLAIVCDGVGGHEGGEIAARETIDYLQEQITQLSLSDKEENNPVTVFKKLTKFINKANDLISQRNDSEQRQERQRMGTTLVMALGRDREMYLAHVGDSRIYWITPNSCHQMTIDDDLASREVRLGYAVYRDSLQYPSSGALIQALGMRDSSALHPNIQRHIIDSDCVFLLCTDGLSDFDRVEQYWKSTILPVLNEKSSLLEAAQKAIRVANTRNGHDNVTLALVGCKVTPKPGIKETTISWENIESAIEDSIVWSEISSTAAPLPQLAQANPPSDTELESAPRRKSSRGLLKLTIGLFALFLVLGGLYWRLNLETNQKSPDNPNNGEKQEKTNDRKF
jgi:protein phosphatase